MIVAALAFSKNFTSKEILSLQSTILQESRYVFYVIVAESTSTSKPKDTIPYVSERRTRKIAS